MVLEYKNKDYEVEIIRKGNKNTYVRVRDHKIYVTTNHLTSERRIKKLLEENKKAIGKMIETDSARMKKRELFLLFGEYYDIIYGDFSHQIVVEDGRISVVSEEVLFKWLDGYVRSVFYSHLMMGYQKFDGNIPCPSLKIRSMKTRWGVCNTKTKVVTLNLELFRYDMECLDYVIVHELAHFLVPNHSKQFWGVVERYCPNYKEIKKKLKV